MQPDYSRVLTFGRRRQRSRTRGNPTTQTDSFRSFEKLDLDHDDSRNDSRLLIIRNDVKAAANNEIQTELLDRHRTCE